MLRAVADKGGDRHARGVRRVMSLPLASRRLNLAGVADVVEFPTVKGREVPFPIEYKQGEAANLSFSVFVHLIRAPDPELRWRGRSRRPPLDPAVGFLHRDRPGRPSLALDLMEKLRAPLADRLARAQEGGTPARLSRREGTLRRSLDLLSAGANPKRA